MFERKMYHDTSAKTKLDQNFKRISTTIAAYSTVFTLKKNDKKKTSYIAEANRQAVLKP